MTERSSRHAPGMHRLACPIQHYAWGSHQALAALQGRPASLEPEAELWMGAHPLAPARLADADRTLIDEIARDPVRTLGRTTVQRFGPTLPFLVKILAAERPLSLQVHPSMEQARAGHAREQAAGIPLHSHERSFKDPLHKPELLVAITPFEAFAGFRAVADTLRLLRAIEARHVDWVIDALARDDAAALARVAHRLLEAPREARTALVADVVRGAERVVSAAGEFAAECEWALALAARYPGDAGILTALLLNLVRLAPGQGMFLPAGNLHVYLRGTGCEIMAASDNVLRGGLTPKHLDVAELLRALDFRAVPMPLLDPRAAGAEAVYDTPAREFRLSRVRASDTPFAATPWGPEIWIAMDGQLALVSRDTTLRLARGEVAFVPASAADLLVTGNGSAFRATVAP